MPKILECGICQKPFARTHSQQKYCSAECSKEGERTSWREYGRRNREARRAYYKRLYEKNREKIIARTKAYQKTPAGKEATRKTDARQKVVNGHKITARTAVTVAIRSGKLTKLPCERCGAKKVEAHHEDYSKPLAVMWLCPEHHRQIHKKEKA